MERDEHGRSQDTDEAGVIELRALVALRSRALPRAESAFDEELGPEWIALAPPAPVAAPSRLERSAPMLLAGSATFALLGLSALAFAAVPLFRAATAESAARTEPAARSPAAVDLPADPPVPEPAPAEVSQQPDAPVVAAIAPRVVDPRVVDPHVAPAAPTRTRHGAPAPSTTRTARAPTRAPSPAATPAAATLDPALEGLLDEALGGSRPAATDVALPAIPPQHQVTATLRALERQVATCREGDGGTVVARIRVSGATGAARDIDVSGDAATTDVERCVTRALEQARFPRFSNNELVVVFPYRV